jgi:hypothetical protein
MPLTTGAVWNIACTLKLRCENRPTLNLVFQVLQPPPFLMGGAEMILPRRSFLKGGGLFVGALAAEDCGSVRLSPQSLAVASFGWEAGNLYGNGADVYFKVVDNMVLHKINVDLSAAILSNNAAGFAEILCTGGVSRQAVPTFSTGKQEYANVPVSSNFGPLSTENPNNLTLYLSGAVYQDQFLSAILKTWVPADGTASATSRQYLAFPSLKLFAGDYLVFHMDHQGVSVDAEMQVVMTYGLT